MDEQTLALKLKMDSSDAKPGVVPIIQAVTDVRTHVGSELGAITKLSDSAFTAIADKLNIFVKERIPVGGGLFINLTENLHSLEKQAETTGSHLNVFNKSVDDLAKSSGKSGDEIKSFLSTFTQLPSAAAKNEAAFKVFGGSVDEAGNRTAALLPQLTQASSQLAALEAGTESFTGTLAASAGTLALVAAVAAAEVTVLYEFIKASIEAAQSLADLSIEMDHAREQTGLTLDQLFGLKIVAEENKVSFEGLTMSFARYLRSVGNAQQEMKGPLHDAFIRMGIDIESLGDDPQKAIEALIQAYGRLGPSILSSQEAVQLIGREGVRALPALFALKGGLNDLAIKGREAGAATAEDVARSKELIVAQVAVTETTSKFTRELGRVAQPEVTHFYNETALLLHNLNDIAPLVAANVLAVSETIDVFVAKPLLGLTEALKLIQSLWQGIGAAALAAGGQGAAAVALLNSSLPGGGTGASPGVSQTPNQPGASPTLTRLTQQAANQALPEVIQDIRLAALATLARDAQTDLKKTLDEVNEKVKQQGTLLQSDTNKIVAAYQYVNRTVRDYIAAQDEIAKKEQERARNRKPIADPIADAKAQKDIDDLRDKAKQADIDRDKGIADTKQAQRDSNQKKEVEAIKAQESAAIEAANREVINDADKNEKIFEAHKASLEQQRDVDIKFHSAQADSVRALNDQIKELEDKRATERLAEVEKERERKFAESRKDDQEALRARKAADDELITELKDRVARTGAIQDDERTQRIKSLDETIAQVSSLVERAIQQHKDEPLLFSLDRTEADVANLKAEAAAAESELKRIMGAQEFAAHEINRIRVADKDAEITTERKGLQALTALKLTPQQLEERQAEFNRKIKALQDERINLIKNGHREEADARQKDIDNLAKYQNNYEKLVLAGLQLDDEISRLRVRLLIATHATLSDILRAEIKEAQDAEKKRNQQELDRLKAEYDAAIKSAKTMQEKLAALKQYHADVKAENDRFAGAVIAATTEPVEKLNKIMNPASAAAIFGPAYQANADKYRKHLAEMGKTASDLQVAFHGVGESIKDSLENKIAALPSLMDTVNGAIDQMVQGLGAMVSQWVLYGNLGPDALRKVTAQVLASFAQQAAVAALYYTAQGIVDLFFDPAQSAADFTAAGIWASIAGGTAIAGRVVAGNAFQSQSGGNASGASAPGSGGGSGGSSSGGGSSSQNSPIVMGSQRGPSVIHLVVEHRASPAFQSTVVDAYVRDHEGGGRTRQVQIKEINRQS